MKPSHRLLILCLSTFFLTSCQNQTQPYVSTRKVLQSIDDNNKYANLVEKQPIHKLSPHKQDEQQLAHAVLSELLTDETLKNSHLQVISYNSNILVVGETDQTSNIDKITSIVKNNPHVHTVKTLVTPGVNINKTQQIQDTLIKRRTLDILSRLTPSQSHIPIIVNDGNLYFITQNDDKSLKEMLVNSLSKIPNLNSIYFIE
ncbi:MAG: hypothetical protein VXY77_01975 [Pseudomonadota bacterium]|nr:hypothetical protein [Pseudomonadota bacterium]